MANPRVQEPPLLLPAEEEELPPDEGVEEVEPPEEPAAGLSAAFFSLPEPLSFFAACL